MNLHAKQPFNPFHVMQTVFPPFSSHARENDPFQPYQFNQNWLQGFQATQQQFLQGYWDWLTWQQWSWQQAFNDNTRWFSHCFELTKEPKTLYRYTRMNWQKPYLGFNEQALTSARLLTQLWTNTFNSYMRPPH